MDNAQELASLFQSTGTAHHQAYIETDGEDAEWPIWYADYLYEKLKVYASKEYTKSELVWLLVEADRQYQQAGADTPWPQYYAEMFTRIFG